MNAPRETTRPAVADQERHRLAARWKGLGWPDEARWLPQDRLLWDALAAGIISWLDAQTVHDLLEMGEVDPPEAAAALAPLLVALLAARRAGSLCVELAPAPLGLWLPPGPEGGPAGCLAAFDHWLARGAFDRLVAADGRGGFLPLVRRDGRLYFQRYGAAEDRLRADLQRRLAPEIEAGHLGGRLAKSTLSDVVQDVMEAPPVLPSGEPLVLAGEQRVGVALALVRNFTVITGGPGTGKTSIVFALLRCLLRLGLPPARIALAAPTGRAAHRLGESLRGQLHALPAPAGDDGLVADLVPATLHRLLAYSPWSGGFQHGSESQLETDVVIVDETSMVDVELMAQLLEATPTGAKVILIGDAYQLPSVEAGAVLADLVEAPRATSWVPAWRERVVGLLGRHFPQDLPRATAAGGEPSLIENRVVTLGQCHRSVPGIIELAGFVHRFPPRPDGKWDAGAVAGASPLTQATRDGERAADATEGAPSRPTLDESPEGPAGQSLLALFAWAHASQGLPPIESVIESPLVAVPSLPFGATTPGVAFPAARLGALSAGGAREPEGTGADHEPEQAEADHARTEAGADDQPAGAGREPARARAEAGRGRACWFLEIGGVGEKDIEPVLRDWVDRFIRPLRPGGGDFPAVTRDCCGETPSPGAMADAFAFLDRAKILTVFRDGWCGASGINAAVGEALRQRMAVKGGSGGWFPGAAVMVTRNEYRLELFNGDTGLILPDQDGSLHGVFPRRDGPLWVPLGELPGPEPAWAVTVHKSQGSEFAEVVLVVPPAPGEAAKTLLTREIIYTGLTRAKQWVAVVSDRSTFLHACSRRANRVSGLWKR
ncbi:MAG: AAA family ATPase [Candidatus Riflebacteria bacterium]|nr:AAA family ATPase [Candidatus Riflebacteria bacterium]